MVYNEKQQSSPTVRIKKLVLDDFKSVEHGEIVFNCGRKFIPAGTVSDILGIYGQNGSGKSSMIEALSIIRYALSSKAIPNSYARCVSMNKSNASVLVIFDLQYPNNVIREVTYSFCLRREQVSNEELTEQLNNQKRMDLKQASFRFDLGYHFDIEKVIIYDEKLVMRWENSSKRTVIIDTSSQKYPFVPDTKRKELVGNKRTVMIDLEVCKQLQSTQSKSFIFSEKLINTIKRNTKDAVFSEVLEELSDFASHQFYVMDSNYSRIAETNRALLIPHSKGFYFLNMNNPVDDVVETYNEKKRLVRQLSVVIEQIVPGLALDYKEVGKHMNEKGQPTILGMLVSRRGDVEIPLGYESDGIKKITSILSLFVFAFYQKSVTVAIDEFDSGIFEYMLGEILQALEEAGKGQFIFTSHNLRPLEVIDKKFLCFTTTNPSNRYIRLKGIAETNNLRDTYYRELILNEQDECMYNRTKKTKLISALRKIGEEWDG